MTFKNPGIKVEDLAPVTTGPLAPRPEAIPDLDPSDMDEVYGQGVVSMSLEDMAEELHDPYGGPAFGSAPLVQVDRESRVVELSEKYMDKLWEWSTEGDWIRQPELFLEVAKIARKIAETLYPKESQ